MGRKKRSRTRVMNAFSKKRKREKYWIEDFPEILSQNASDITLYLTRAQLTDDLKNACGFVNSVVKQPPLTTSQETGLHLAEEKGDVVSTISNQETVDRKTNNDSIRTDETTHPILDRDDFEEVLPSSCPREVILDSGAACRSSENNETTTFSTASDIGSSEAAPSEPQIFVQRAPAERSQFLREVEDFCELPFGDCGDGVKNPHSPSEVPHKYWAQRRRLFSRFEEGIKLDKEGWFSVTPEVIARHIAERMVNSFTCKEGLVVLDAFCGVGGNSIAFAARPEVALVICVDTDMSRLQLAAHNCNVYEIPKEKVIFILADACDVLAAFANGSLLANYEDFGSVCSNDDLSSNASSGYLFGGIKALPRRLDAIFLSPPWGGTGYLSIGPRNFDLSQIRANAQVDGEELLLKAFQAVRKDGHTNIAYFLPRNTNGLSLARSAFLCGFRGHLELEMNMINGKFKTITAYLIS